MMARHSYDFLEQVMNRPAMDQLIAECLAAIDKSPDACVVLPRNSAVQVRTGAGKRTWVSMRVLMWLHQNGGTEAPNLGKSKCGTAGCVNPAHQQLAPMPQPRVKVVHGQPV